MRKKANFKDIASAISSTQINLSENMKTCSNKNLNTISVMSTESSQKKFGEENKNVDADKLTQDMLIMMTEMNEKKETLEACNNRIHFIDLFFMI